MKILVTGGLGTIGSCLVAELFKAGHTVTVYDNMEIGTPLNLLVYLTEEQIAKIQIVRADILDRDALSKAFEDIDLVYHLAATLGTLNVVAQPSRMMNVNSIGSHIVTDLAVSKLVPLILMSTSMVYGCNPKTKVSEKDDLFVGGSVDVGLWWYAISKMADEAYANSVMLERKDAKITIVRPFNVIAPIQSDLAGFVFPAFFAQHFLANQC